MIRLLILSLSLLLPSLTVAADDRGLREATTVCEAYLSPMRDVMATLRQGGTLTDGQEALWRVWNKRCAHASWQQALAEGLPPARTEYPPNPPAPRVELTWRDYVGAALTGIERGMTAPQYICQSRITTRGATVTTCGPR